MASFAFTTSSLISAAGAPTLGTAFEAPFPSGNKLLALTSSADLLDKPLARLEGGGEGRSGDGRSGDGRSRGEDMRRTGHRLARRLRPAGRHEHRCSPLSCLTLRGGFGYLVAASHLQGVDVPDPPTRSSCTMTTSDYISTASSTDRASGVRPRPPPLAAWAVGGSPRCLGCFFYDSEGRVWASGDGDVRGVATEAKAGFWGVGKSAWVRVRGSGVVCMRPQVRCLGVWY